jgi:hypothetical protein
MPQPERLDPNDILAALGDTAGDNDPGGDLARIGTAAKAELLRRLEDPEQAGELASTGLLNLVVVWAKDAQKNAAPTEDQSGLDPIDIIMGTTLSNERKRTLLQAERDKTIARTERITLLLDQEPPHE